MYKLIVLLLCNVFHILFAYGAGFLLLSPSETVLTIAFIYSSVISVGLFFILIRLYNE